MRLYIYLRHFLYRQSAHNCFKALSTWQNVFSLHFSGVFLSWTRRKNALRDINADSDFLFFLLDLTCRTGRWDRLLHSDCPSDFHLAGYSYRHCTGSPWRMTGRTSLNWLLGSPLSSPVWSGVSPYSGLWVIHHTDRRGATAVVLSWIRFCC